MKPAMPRTSATVALPEVRRVVALLLLRPLGAPASGATGASAAPIANRRKPTSVTMTPASPTQNASISRTPPRSRLTSAPAAKSSEVRPVSTIRPDVAATIEASATPARWAQQPRRRRGREEQQRAGEAEGAHGRLEVDGGDRPGGVAGGSAGQVARRGERHQDARGRAQREPGAHEDVRRAVAGAGHGGEP